MKACCPSCVDGVSGEECTGGKCWDCRGTGHPHAGPCGFWRWWLDYSLDLLFGLYAFMIVSATVLATLGIDGVWMWIFVGVAFPYWTAWLTIEAMYDRRWRVKR